MNTSAFVFPSTKVICTLGPATLSEENIYKLAQGGMSIARLNMSHGKWENHLESIKMIRKVNERLLREKGTPTCIAIMLDTKGPEIRTGDVAKPIVVKEGEDVIFSFRPLPKQKLQVIPINHDYFAEDARDADSIILDNGKMTFRLRKVQKDGSVIARADEAGVIGSRRHVNLPGADLKIDSVTDRDWEDLAHSAEAHVDFIALSFVREAKDIERVRDFLKKKKCSAQLIAKIETRQAVENMAGIVDAADGIMVARGDLGSEVPFERIPVIQDELVALCRECGKPVIVATHMLESMIDNPMPTRAEVTDIAHAAGSGTDATMLSGETANGKFPFNALDAMTRVLRATEAHLALQRKMEPALVRNEKEAQAEAAATLATSTDASAIVVISKTGQTAKDVSRCRPSVPVVAFAPDTAVQHRMQMLYGVTALCVPFHEKDPEKTVISALKTGKEWGFLKKGGTCVLVSDSKADKVVVRTVQIRELP